MGQYFKLKDGAVPDYKIVFNSDKHEYSYGYPNPLIGTVWLAEAEMIAAGGEYVGDGVYKHPFNAPQSGLTDTHLGRVAKLVQAPAKDTILYSTAPRTENAAISSFRLATVSSDGSLTNPRSFTLSDNWSGLVNKVSATAKEFLFLPNSGDEVRFYELDAKDGNVLNFVKTVPLSTAASLVNAYSQQFAFDGYYFYFAVQHSDTATEYQVFSADGMYIENWNIDDDGLGGLYFEWSVGRYNLYSGHGYIGQSATYKFAVENDSSTYTTQSIYHELVSEDSGVKIGDQLIEPEEGWNRFDSQHEYIKYIGTWGIDTSVPENWYMQSGRWTQDPNAKAVFKFYGTKLRYIGLMDTNKKSNNGWIKVDGVVRQITQYGSNVPMQLQQEFIDLPLGIHVVEVYPEPTQLSEDPFFDFTFDALDIDADGYIIEPDKVPDQYPVFLFRDGEDIKKYIKPSSDEPLRGGSVSASLPNYDRYVASNMFDGNPNTKYWSNASGPVTITYMHPTQERLVGYAITGPESNQEGDSPGSWILQGSNDGAAWTTLDEKSGIIFSANERKEFTIDALESFSRYRLFNLYPQKSGNWIQIAEIELIPISQEEQGWIKVGTSPVTQNMFADHGMTSLADITNEVIQELVNDEIEVLCMDDELSDSHELKLTAIPNAKLIVGNEDIQVSDLGGFVVNTTVSGASIVRLIISGDSGATWVGKTDLIISDLPGIKLNGFTPEEFNALTVEQVKAICPSGTFRIAYYIEQEKSSDAASIDLLSYKEKVFQITPSVESLKVFYDLTSALKPKLFASRDNGVTWKQVNEDAITKIDDLPEGNQLRIKVVLENGQEVYGISYSWI